jgi:DNA-binding MarR family transcriptional regulator
VYETLGWLVSSEPRVVVLKALNEHAHTPSGIADDRGVRLEYVSRALGELADEGLVECRNPEAHKGRIYTVTQDGEEVLRKALDEGLV